MAAGGTSTRAGALASLLIEDADPAIGVAITPERTLATSLREAMLSTHHVLKLVVGKSSLMATHPPTNTKIIGVSTLSTVMPIAVKVAVAPNTSFRDVATTPLANTALLYA